MLTFLSLVLSCLVWLWAASRWHWSVFTFLIVIPLVFSLIRWAADELA